MTITASRGLVKELEDGRLEVVITVHRQCAADFLAAVQPGGWLEIGPAEKPPTQGMAPAAADAMVFAKQLGFDDTATCVSAMSKHPYFQMFAATGIQPDDVITGNAVKDTEAWVIKRSRDSLGTHTDPEKLKQLTAQYIDFCKLKGINPNG